MVSLHQADHILYHYAGPVKRIALVWITACMVTSTGILADALQTKSTTLGGGVSMRAKPPL